MAAADKAGRIYAVIQNRRYLPEIRALVAFLRSGAIGRLQEVHSDFFIGAHFGGFRDETAHVLLLDMAIHTFDAARMITGEDALSVTCAEWNPRGSWYRHGASAMGVFQMTNDVVYSYRGSWCAEGLNTTWEASWRIIGEVHRKAARMDGGIELVAGVFSSHASKNRQTGREQCIEPRRAYTDYRAMIEGKLALPEDRRIDFVTITVPNHWHFAMARDFLRAGLMHNYTGYPMVKLARDMVRQGDLGRIYKVVVQYPQGWLVRPIERDGQTQASWRTDPKRSGAAGCMGDIGTHAANLAEYITGLKLTQICADLTTFVKGRRLDDDGNCLIRFNKGAKGVLHASQVSIGEENDLAIWVYGENHSLEWHQEHPNYLYVNRINGPQEVWKRGNDYIGAKSAAAGRARSTPGTRRLRRRGLRS